MSIELQNAMEKDMAEIKEDGTPDYIDTAPENTIIYDEEQPNTAEDNAEIHEDTDTNVDTIEQDATEDFFKN